MAIRNLGTILENSLLNNDEFNYAHLVKFEKPTVQEILGKTSRKANTYAYITDSAFDIVWNDGSKDAENNANGDQNYNANKLQKVGSVSETTEAKSSNITIVLDSTSLGASLAASQLKFQSTTLTGPYGTNFVEAGFQEGDKVLVTSTNSSAANINKYLTITTFKEDGKAFNFTTPDSISASLSWQSYPYTVSLVSEEISTLTSNKEATTYTTYLNREVFIYKAHLNVDTNAIIGEPYLLFKGIIANGSIKESPEKTSQITWSLSSHWGDFARVSGRLTVDEAHRALDGNGVPDDAAVIREDYAGDLGFAHANQSLNVMALYNDIEISYKQVDINGGWPGGKRMREVETVVQKRTDLAFNLSPKYLPVVYGVQKIDAIPVFVDTSNTNAAEIFVAYAMCEGPIAGLLDLYIDGNSSICVDKADFDLRAGGGDTVDLVCKGRMDKGDALTGYNANNGYGSTNDNLEDYWGMYGTDGGARYRAQFRAARAQQQNYSGVASGAITGPGILHEKTHTITSPLNGHFQLHVGKPDQKANSTLVNKASANGFKIQNDYYDGDRSEYWGSNHQLLDTAYTVGKFTIAAGETTIPEIDFVVRGKGVNCFNYDRSYANTNTTSADEALFKLGDSVTIKKTSDNSTISTATIIDKWDFLDAEGAAQTRIITDYTTDITVAHYIQDSGTNKWYMSAHKTTENIEGTITAAAKTTISSSTSGAGGSGLDVTVAANAATEAAIAAAVADLFAEGILAFSGSGRRDLELGSFFDWGWNSSTRTFSNIGSGTSVTSLDNSITEVFVKDAVILNSSDAEADGYYNGQEITLQRFNASGVPKTQVRTITSYTATGNVAIVHAPWDAEYFPDVNDTYTISAGKPDVRVSLNPAMQLLDYLTSERYGRGLDLDLDIDLDTFKQAARACDTRSNITVQIAGDVTGSLAVGSVYKSEVNSILRFRGTVESITLRSVGGSAFTEVVFKDVIGKLLSKWNSWRSYEAGDYYWNAGKVYLKGTLGTVPNAPTSGHLTSGINLFKVSGTGPSTLVTDIATSSSNGNPIIKKWVGFNATATEGSFIGSGYSLYDADDIKYWKYIGWDSNGQRNVTRHQMNQTVSTSNPIFDNINLMLKQFNGVLRYSNGKYQLDIKGQTPSVFVNGEVLDETDIIGDISVKDAGVKKSYNSVSTSIKDPQTKFESRSVSFFNSTYLKQDKNIPKKGSYGMPGVTNYFNARFNVNQMLDESRYGLTVSFKMMPKGLLLQPGSIIKLNYPRFGWSNKEFRVSNLTMNTDCLISVTADEHNNNAYLVKNLSKPVVGSEIEMGAPQNKNRPGSPTSFAGSTNHKGAITLTWVNATDFSTDSHSTEIYSHTSNDRSGATLYAGNLQGLELKIPVTESSETTKYYWVRHVVQTPSAIVGGLPKTVRSNFSPNTTQGITGQSVLLADGERGPGRWHIGVSSLPATASAAATAWTNGTGEQPTLAVADDQAWFYTGTIANPTGQKVWIYNGTAWVNQVEAVDGGLVVDGTVTTAEIAGGTILEGNIDQTSTGGKFGEVVAALGTFTQVDTDVLNANSVIAREVQVFPAGATPPTISGTTLAGAGIDLKQDGDMYVGNASANKYMFWDQSEGTMTFRGTLNVDDITGSSATFATLMAEVATIGTLNTKMLDSEAIVTRDIRVGPSDEITAGSFVTGTEYYITDLGNTTQAQWNSVAGTSGVVYNLGGIFTAQNAGTGTGKARNRTTVAKIAGATLTGAGAHLNAAGDFYVGNAAANKYMFWDQSAGTMTLRGELNADDITAGSITANRMNVTNLSAITANLGDVTAGTLSGGTLPEATSAPTGTEAGAFLDLGVGRMVLGNASKYIWWDGTNLTINGVTISNASLANSSGFATETYVDDEITALLDGAPDALNTLNELAAAVNDDQSFAASVTTSLGNKVSTNSNQALSTAGNAMTISGSTITLARANGSTDTVAVPDNNTQYTAGSGLALSGTTFSNSSPDRTVSLTGSGATSVSGTYPNFTITSTNSNTQRSDEEIRDLAAGILTAGTNVSISVNDAANTATISSTDTNTQYTAGSGLSLSGTTFSNSAPDQTVALTAGSNISVSGTYPNFSISSTNTNTQRTDEEIRDVAASIITAGTNVSVVKNDAADTVTINSTDTNTQYSAGSGLSLSGTTFTNSSPDRTVTLTGGGTTSVSGSYPDFTITSNADSGNASQLGGENASHYLNVDTTFGGDVSGKYNAIVIADDSHNHIISNIDGLQTALNGKVDDGQVLTNVPTGALFTDTNTNYFLNGISKSGNTLTFSVSGSTNQTFTFGTNAFTSHSAPHYTSAIVSSDVTTALGFTPGTSSLALGTSSSTALAGNTSIPQGDITNVTATSPLTGGGTTGSISIGITQASASANGYLSSTDWTTFNNKSTFNGAYSSLSGRPTLFDGAYGSLSGRPTLFDGAYGSLSGTPTIPAQVSLSGSGATTISGTYPNFTISSTDNNTNTTNFGIRAEAGAVENISAGETVTFRGVGATTVSRSGNNIDISSTNTDRYVNSASFNSGNGVLTLTRAGSDTVAVTVDLDGRYATVNDTGTPAILSNGAAPSLNSGISAAEVRSLIGAGTGSGTSNLAIGTTSTTAMAGNTTFSSGVSTVQVGTNVNAISVSGGTTATATLSAHATLEAIADGVAVSNLDVDFLKADTIVANKITANTITMNKLKTSPVANEGSVEIGTAGIRILDSSNVLRVAIGNLSRLATSRNNA